MPKTNKIKLLKPRMLAKGAVVPKTRASRGPVSFEGKDTLERDRHINVPFATYAREFADLSPRNEYIIVVMEGPQGKTTTALRDIGGFSLRQIIAFTGNRRDYELLKSTGLTMRKRCTMSDKFYTITGLLGAHAIYLHDSMQNGCAVFEDIKLILLQKHKTIGVGVNMTTRCPDKCHRSVETRESEAEIFEENVTEFALKQGYWVSHRRMQRYKRMQPYWFNFYKIDDACQ
jgi:hypothetical protein